MENKKFTTILQVALWKKEGMGELEIRQHLIGIGSNDEIQEGIKLYTYLEELK